MGYVVVRRHARIHPYTHVHQSARHTYTHIHTRNTTERIRQAKQSTDLEGVELPLEGGLRRLVLEGLRPLQLLHHLVGPLLAFWAFLCGVVGWGGG